MVLGNDAQQNPHRGLNALVGTVLTIVGLPTLMPLPWWQMLVVFGYAVVSCLVVNDALKVAMIKWRAASVETLTNAAPTSTSSTFAGRCWIV